jgi:UrcA family protein
MKRFIIAATLAATAFAGPALAASNSFQMDVDYSAKKLSTEAGAEAEYAHIHELVEERCSTENANQRVTGTRVTGSYARAFCIHTTMDSAIRSINNEHLNKVHAERR